MKDTIEVKVNYDTIRIYIDNTLYVLIKRNEFAGLQSWAEGANKYCIEFYTNNTSILTEQDSKEKWINIINALDKNLFI